ncbi:MAG: MBL fold metallo-hydrolase [Spirochaetota bacterium]
MRFTFLGTGTSDGVPMIACDCAVCKSRDRRDVRTRTSAMIEHEGRVILIDASFDMREQMLRENVKRLDAILLTHPHADHVFGLDDLRQLNRITGTMPVYCNRLGVAEIHERFGYFFNPKQRGGGVSQIELRETTRPFTLFGLRVVPLPVKHGILDILGYRIGDMSYITDASFIPDAVVRAARGSRVLVLNALRYRKHSTHFSLQEAVDMATRIGAERTYFVHFTHDVKHAELAKELPRGMMPAYDGLRLTL